MSIRDLMDQFVIEGAYQIKGWADEYDDNLTVFASGNNFDDDKHKIKDDYLDAEIIYMYVLDGSLIIEIVKGDKYE